MADEKKEVLEVGLELRSALADFTKFQRASTKTMENISRSVEKLNKVNAKVNREAKEGTKDWMAGLGDLTKAYKKEGNEIKKFANILHKLDKQAQTASGKDLKNIKQSIKLTKNLMHAKVKALKTKEEKEGRVSTNQQFKAAGKEMKESFKDTMKSVFVSRDVKDALENSAKLIVKSLKVSALGGMKLKGAGANLMTSGKEKGGAMGMGMRAGGAAMKGLGSLMGGFKPLIEGLSKIGPILQAAGSFAFALVKMFLDMDEKVKGFNKDILQSASNLELVSRAGGDTDLALDDMRETLDGIRDAAYDLDNISWGISADEVKGMVNTLTQEGVSLGRIRSEAKESGQTVQEFTKDLSHMSVAYSRAFGVPLQQINELQSELMTEMGANLKDTKIAFQQMTRAADDSGIAANKFFNMIRGVSQDLSLWGTRMEDAVKLLGRLGQVMNPRNAQKFMQTAVQGLKNMGRTERLRLTLLTGQGKMGKLVERDINRKAKGLADKFGLSAEDLVAKLQSKEGRADLEGRVQKMDPAEQGAMREAMIDAQLQVERKKKGTFGTATAARNLGPAAALEAMQGALAKFGGGKKLSDIVGTIGGEMMAENLGISEEQLDGMAKFERSIDNQREVLRNQLKSGDKEQADQAREALKRAGVNAQNDEDLSKEIDKAGYDQIMDTLSDGDKKALTEEAKVEDMAKKQADLQTSILQKLQMLLDWMMNQLYDLLMDIWDGIMSIPGVGKSSVDKDTKRAVLDSKDPGLAKILRDVGGDAYKFRGEVGKQFGKQLSDALTKDQTGTEKTISDLVSKMDPMTQVRATHDAALSAGLDNDKALGLAGLVESGKSLSEAADSMKIDGDQRKALMHQMGLAQLDPSKVAALAASLHGGTKEGDKPNQAPTAAPAQPKGGGPAATPTAPEPPPQVKSDNKDAAKIASDNLSLTKDQLSTMESVDAQMDKFKMDTSFLSGPYSKAVEGSVLKAVRTALFEYYMYKDLDKGQVLGAMAQGGYTPSTFGASFLQTARGTGSADAGTLTDMTSHAALSTALQRNASGGMVTGVNNGLAQVTAAAGEGLASVGPGERIVPRGGGGGGGVNVTVNGVGGQDLARIIEAKVVDGIHEYKRKERFSG